MAEHYDLDFTSTANTHCDSCGRPTRVGVYHNHNGTPVLFECVPCGERTASVAAVAAAVERHKDWKMSTNIRAGEYTGGGLW